ncbi:unnamed protein product [Heligmosomoides polygyrus]|uniref:40S ribosomal protein S7 n=1 Tax=Heligmosomoides polygyrus TaxID=6339 RepID=A0A3P7Z4D8_HELPZ|nr:unnamed protein product [Heligmosomoides polygyrus]
MAKISNKGLKLVANVGHADKTCPRDAMVDGSRDAVAPSKAGGNNKPTCPLPFCSNPISLTELRTLIHRSTTLKNLGALAEKLISDQSNEMAANKDEITVESYIYGREATNKRIIIPKVCLIADLINAVLQMQHLAKNRTTSSISIFIRHEMEKGLYKYEKLISKELGKKTVKDLNWGDPTYVVVDIDNQLSRYNRR